MKPTSLKPGDRIAICIDAPGSRHLTGTFVKRIPGESGRPAQNLVNVDEFRGLDTPDDEGRCAFSDYDIARKCNPLDQKGITPCANTGT